MSLIWNEVYTFFFQDMSKNRKCMIFFYFFPVFYQNEVLKHEGVFRDFNMTPYGLTCPQFFRDN
jgi:hypothetical protein